MSNAIRKTFQLGTHWPTEDPFLFCAHHHDNYPPGNDEMGPSEPLTGRHVGQDFSGKDGWSMYHGQKVPGFPHHPHRGFETVTIARNGFIDHRDSLGAASRFGNGDVQWMTAGKGVVHSEMFPLVKQDERNPTELFQIWLNLPAKNKLVDPHFTMFWHEDVPTVHLSNTSGENTGSVRIIAGSYGNQDALTPPPESWAAEADAQVRILTAKLDPGAEWHLEPVDRSVSRNIYFFVGSTLTINGQKLGARTGVSVDPTSALDMVNGDDAAEILVLEGRPIGEPVAQRGPFVMNYEGEIRQAILDYQQTQFGGWPWPAGEQAHPREKPRFAVHPDGRTESP